MSTEVFVAGVGMLKFGRYPDKDVPELGGEAALLALDDAGLGIRDVEMLAAGCLFQANAMVGQRILQEIGQTGIPVVNVANACATGSTAFREAAAVGRVGRVRGRAGGRRRADGEDGAARRRRRLGRSAPRASSAAGSCRRCSGRPAWSTCGSTAPRRRSSRRSR